jgi:hypothetical protein
MQQSSAAYSRYFREELRVNVAIHPPDRTAIDVGCIVLFLEGDRLGLELCGDEFAEGLPAESGMDVHLTAWTGWSLCWCNAVLAEKTAGRRFQLRLTGKVAEKQSREYFRLDVSIPFLYSIPEKQLMPEVQAEWSTARELIQRLPSPVIRPCHEGFRLTGWNGRGEILPQRVNLSGGGLRMRTREYVEPRTLVAIDLFLPLVPRQVIHVVAEALRCNEIVLGRQSGVSYNTALRFHFIEETDREAIISFIFSEQRRLLSAQTGSRF